MAKCWFFFFLIFSASSAAQQQSHLDVATELFEAKNSEKSVQQTYDRIIAQMPEFGTQLGLPEDRQAWSERYMEELVAVVKEIMTWERMRDEHVAMYTEVFTEQELRELVDFYKSPIGKKYVSRQPEMAQAAMQITGEMMRELMPRIKEISSKVQAEETESQPKTDR